MLLRYAAMGSTLFLLAACAPDGMSPERLASVERGKVALRQHDCGVCHRIPGIRAARGEVGPSLQHYAQRIYVAGKFPHDDAHLASWIQDPPALAPSTAMPNQGVSEQEARDIAAYLRSLR